MAMSHSEPRGCQWELCPIAVSFSVVRALSLRLYWHGGWAEIQRVAETAVPLQTSHRTPNGQVSSDSVTTSDGDFGQNCKESVVNSLLLGLVVAIYCVGRIGPAAVAYLSLRG